LLKVISLATVLALLPAAAQASRPSLADVDAHARASGSLKALAVSIGKVLFATTWPAQIQKVYADGIGAHHAAGLRVAGTHFHAALTRRQFMDEIAELIRRTFAASDVEEVDVWAAVPLAAGRGVIVSGDLAKPTSRTVFTISARRGEPADGLLARLNSGRGVFWDQEWARTALK